MPTSHPKNQKGKAHTQTHTHRHRHTDTHTTQTHTHNTLINAHEDAHAKPEKKTLSRIGGHSDTSIKNSSNIYFYQFSIYRTSVSVYQCKAAHFDKLLQLPQAAKAELFGIHI